MKKLFMISLFLFTSFMVKAQFIFPGKENQHSIFGGENGKNYAAIFSTKNSSRQEAILQSVRFLTKYRLVVDSTKVLESVKEYDETQNEFTVPVDFRFGWHGTAPTMGAVAPLYPVYLTADLLFQFYNEGKIRLVIKNFREKSYFEWATRSKSCKITPESILGQSQWEEYQTYMLAPTMQAGLGKQITNFLVWANSGIEHVSDIEDALKDYLDNIDVQISLTEKLKKGGYYIFGTPEKILAEYRNLDKDGKLQYVPTAYLDKFEKEITEERLVFFYPYFWNREVKTEFNYIIIALNKFFGGSIEGIAEDGELTWELVDGQLLPVDAKLRKKLTKKKQNYFTYYGE